MIHTANTVRTLQAVAMSVGLAVLIWSTGLPSLMLTASAASITSASDTLSNSAPGLTSNHTIGFTTANGMATSSNFTLTFQSEFDTSAVTITDIDLSTGGVDRTIQSGAAGAGVWGVSGIGTDAITFTTPTDASVASSSAIVIKIGSNAVGGTIRIVNPVLVESYTIDIAGTMQDSGQVRVAIVDQVVVSANVDTSLTFTVTGVVSGVQVNNSGTTTVVNSTPTTLPFGTLSATGTPRVLAHDLAVTTNASGGYTVTVQQTGDLQSSTGATIDGFLNGQDTSVPTTWDNPSRLIGNTDTWGHWGLTSEDFVTGRASEFSSNTWVSGSTTAPIIIMGHNDPADGTTAGIGATRVGYKIQISPLQEAGDDYTTTLRYVATPLF